MWKSRKYRYRTILPGEFITQTVSATVCDKVSELRGDAHSFFIKVTILQTSHYAGGFCSTDASWSYTFKDD